MKDISNTTIDKKNNMFPTVIKLIGNTTLITAMLSVLYAFFYLISYSFLFGYYFSGTSSTSISNFEIIRSFVPFDLNTTSFTIALIFFTVAIGFSIIQVFFSKDFLHIFVVVVGFIIFHYYFTVFFTKEATFMNMLYLGTIWILAFILATLIIFLNRGIKNGFKAITGILVGLISGTLLSDFLSNRLNESQIGETAIVITSVFIIGFISTYIPYNKITKVFFIMPHVSILIAFIINLTPFNFNYFYILLSFLVSGIISFFKNDFLKKFKITNINVESPVSLRLNLREIKENLSKKENRNFSIFFLFVFLFLIFVMVPRLSASTGQLVREVTPSDQHNFQSIEVLSLDNSILTIDGILVAEKENTIYIADKNWQLQQIKTSHYLIK